MKSRAACWFFPALLLLCGTSQARDTTGVVFLRSISIFGNKHTRAPVILRELVLQDGKSYTHIDFVGRVERSRQNLMNTALFNFVEMDTVFNGDTVDLTINFTERWYLWPSPVFELVDPNFNTWWQTRDFRRTSYGGQLTAYNVRGRNETLRARIKAGYNEQLSLSYEFPYINSTRTLGFALYLHYGQNYQVTYGTFLNKRLFYTAPSGKAREDRSVGMRFQYRKRNNSRHFFLLKFNEVKIADTLADIESRYLSDGTVQRGCFEVGYQFTHDVRDYSPYPLRGRYFTVSAFKPDIDAGKKKYHNGIVQAYLQYKKYIPINDVFYFAFSATGKHTLFKGQLPYYFQRGLGYQDFVRGYEYYVIDAQSYAAVKSNLKFRLLKAREYRIKFIRNERFNRLFLASYFNVNLDAGFAVDKLNSSVNPLANTFLPGGGIGIDFITFYDLVLRCEYSFNRLGESGFFLHFSKPI